MTQLLLRVVAMIAVATLTACVTPQPYRFDGKILQPNTRIATDESISIDVLGVQPTATSCDFRTFQASDQSGEPSGGIVRGHFVYVGVSAAPALRLTFGANYFKSLEEAGNLRGRVRASIGKWLTDSKIGACLTGAMNEARTIPLAEMIARQVYAQRPMTATEAIYSWYGPGEARPASESGVTTNLESRVVILRPGMRVCAQDVSKPSADGATAMVPAHRDEAGQAIQGTLAFPSFRYTVGGTACAWVTDGPNGPEFSSSIGRLSGEPLSDEWPDGEFAFVTSWDEVQSLEAKSSETAGRHFFAIVHGTDIPTTPTNGPDGLWSFLVRVSPDSGMPSLKYCVGSSRTVVPCEGLDALQFGASALPGVRLCKEKHVVCAIFGKRTTFSVEFAVTVNGTRVMVPVAATLASVAAQIAPDFLGPESASLSDPAYVEGADRDRLDRALSRVRLRRWFEGRRVDVRLSGDKPWDFPLQPGDTIRW